MQRHMGVMHVWFCSLSSRCEMQCGHPEGLCIISAVEQTSEVISIVWPASPEKTQKGSTGIFLGFRTDCKLPTVGSEHKNSGFHLYIFLFSPRIWEQQDFSSLLSFIKSLVDFKHDSEAFSGHRPTSQSVIATPSPPYPLGSPKGTSRPRITDGNKC